MKWQLDILKLKQLLQQGALVQSWHEIWYQYNENVHFETFLSMQHKENKEASHIWVSSYTNTSTNDSPIELL